MPKQSWTDDNYHKSYALAQSGMSDRQIGKALGVTRATFDAWKDKRPSLRNSLSAARSGKDRGETQSFREYVYDKLDPVLKKLWDDINACEVEENGVQRVEALLKHAGRNARQHLFLYAFTSSNFNATEACRKVNIGFSTFRLWVESDPDFAKLIDEIHWHKGNFFEQALINCVDRGDTIATIFANKTFNKERGYGEKTTVDVNVSGQINHLSAVLKIDELDLPLDVRKTLLEALREKKRLRISEQTLEDVDVA